MVFGNQSHDLPIQIESIPIAESREQKLLGITLDKNWHLRHTLNHYAKRQIKNSMLSPAYPPT